MHAGGTTRERDIETFIEEHRNVQRRHERPPDFHQYAGIHMFQPHQHHRRTATLGRARACHQPVSLVAQVIGDGDQAQSHVVWFDHFPGVRVNDQFPTMITGAPLVPVRLATTCREDSAAAISDAVRELIDAFHARNDCQASSVRLAIFTATADLRSAKPATAARHAGWHETQFLCLAEMPTNDDVAFCLRALLMVDRAPSGAPLKPVYLNGAQMLRPDLSVD